MANVLIIADDLTGAADTGLQFRRAGHSVRIRFADGGTARDTHQDSVLVVTTETRNAPAAEAERILRSVGEVMVQGAAPTLFKKIDSTLRGQVGIEIRTLLDYLPGRIAWTVPAYPQLGRRMENGVYTVNGVPLAATEFAHEIPHCPADSRIVSLLETQSGEPVAHVGAEIIERGADAITARISELTRGGTVRALLFDAATDTHIEHIVVASEQSEVPPLWVGSAGLAGALTKHTERKEAPSAPPSIPDSPAPVLVVAGSRNPVTRRQLHVLQKHEPSLLPHVVMESSDPPHNPATLTPRGILLTLPDAAPNPSPSETGRAAARLGEAAARTITEVGCDRLILTGGDIAAATCRRLNVDAMEIIGALEEGIPLLRLHGGAANSALVVTKAGGFGTEESLHRAFKFLTGTL
jgi:uncharacterized protein YgbK (DUF1537 family)